MDKLLIEWGKLDRTEALEASVNEKAKKVLKFHPDATKLIVTLQIINPLSSKGPATQKVSMELRMPNRQDIRSSKEGANIYTLISEAERALLSQRN
jgi:ribosome-associated translation inhibitor RaiA